MSGRLKELRQPDKHFGHGMIPGENNFFPELSKRERVFVLGMLDACPEPNAMIKTFSLDWIIRRYSECNLVGSFILQKAFELNWPLAVELVKSELRLNGEEPQHYEAGAVPSDYLTTLYPGSTIAGYAASRILIEQFGRERPWEIGDPRVTKGFYILESAFEISSTPIEFVVNLARLVIQHDAGANAVLGHLLAIELKNEGIFSQIREVGVQMRKLAPDLWKYYEQITSAQRTDRGILPIELVA